VIKQYTDKTVYNFGRARRNLTFGYYLSRYLLDSGRKPKYVVMGIHYHDFTELSRPYMIFPMLKNSSERLEQAWQFSTDRSYVPGRNSFLADRYSSDMRMMLSRLISWAKSRKRAAPYRFTSDRGFNATHREMKEVGDSENYKEIPFNYTEANVEILKKTIQLWKSQRKHVS